MRMAHDLMRMAHQNLLKLNFQLCVVNVLGVSILPIAFFVKEQKRKW